MLLIMKRFLKVNGCRASELSIVIGTPQCLFGGDFYYHFTMFGYQRGFVLSFPSSHRIICGYCLKR